VSNCYVFVDESGNNDFSPSGTDHWVLTSLITSDPAPGVLDLYDLKRILIDSGTDIEYFHASEDRQAVRDEVFEIIGRLTNIRADSLVVEKRKTHPALRPFGRFYPQMMSYLLQYTFDPKGVDIQAFDRVVLFLDRARSTRNQQRALIASVKQYLAHHLGGIPYHIVMHSSASHPYLQIVDYLSWAVYVKWERGERRPYDEVRHLFRSEIPIFEHGADDWY